MTACSGVHEYLAGPLVSFAREISGSSTMVLLLTNETEATQRTICVHRR